MDLKFDTMEVNTKLAEDFLAVHKAQLEQIQASGNVHEFTNTPLEVQTFDDKHVRLKVLADKIQENAELIAQLEVLKRGKVKEDVLNYDLKLIVAHFKYWSSKPTYPIPVIALPPPLHVQPFQEKDYPLAFLGYIAEKMYAGSNIELQCDINTLPVVYLFAILFRQAGLESIKFRYYASVDIAAAEKRFKDWNGCTAVIGEHVDVDSAVDALLAATSHDPWRLQRIYVQESRYATVKSALSWKCTPKNTSSQAGGDKSKESDTFIKYGQKEFIFDYPVLVSETIQEKGTSSTHFVHSYQRTHDNTPAVFVEAYRTVKELLSLLQKDTSFCMSLWSSDISESYEIAFNVRTPVVWVNDYGDSDGSARLSQAFYSTLHGGRVLKCNEEVGKLRDNWSKLSTEKRVEIITKALQKLESSSDDMYLKQEAHKLNEAIREVPCNKSFENTKGKMWINFNVHKEVILINQSINVYKLEEALKSVALGNVLLYDGPRGNDDKSDLLRYLCVEKLPFILPYSNPESAEKSVLEKVYTDYNRSRTIVISFGTIFAN